MAIINLNDEIATYAQNWVADQGPGYSYAGKFGYAAAGTDPTVPPFTVSNIVATPATTVVNFAPNSFIWASQQTVVNDGSTQVTKILTFSQGVTNTNSTSTTNGVVTNYSITSKTTLKLAFGVKQANSITEEIDVTFGQTYNYSTTESNTLTDVQNWSDQISVPVPPNTTAVVNYYVLGGNYSIDTSLTCEFTGTIWFMVNYPNGQQQKVYMPLYNVVTANGLTGYYPPTNGQFAVTGINDPIYFGGNGTISGAQGVASTTTITTIQGGQSTTTQPVLLSTTNSDGTVTGSAMPIPVND
ncbi:ETX/MTX2 family pore-forming toxin [Bacillus cereus]|uniref:Uncharacterized protein n=1 Tax=Bacillus cereus TaxID=1396 RepID=A0A9X6X0I8_BACCE|nr:ETX/MTX2 family pore-forming toxin [Bacillus cereus]PFK18501.1 hypothetical protein COI98_12580 [Bacillus cereus]